MKTGRRFRSKGNDSLDLLLDTICNAFGGIVLIAILITLLTRDTQDRMEEQASSADRELIERQIASLQSDVKEAQEYLQRQATTVSVDPNLLSRRDELKGTLETAKGKNDEAWVAWKDSASKAAGNDPASDKALGDRVSITSRLSRLKTENVSLNEKLDRLKMRLDTLRQERADTVNSKAEQLRLPKEQPERGGNVYFLLKNNEIFPVRVARNGFMVHNEESLVWRDIDPESDEATTQPGRGVSPSAIASALGATFDAMLEQGNYATLDVDSRSAEAYRALRAELLRRRIPFGWSFDDATTVVFSTRGSKPPPL
jgi:hypothetical protein